MQRIVIALGFANKKDGLPTVLYIGRNADAALKTVEAAGAARKINFGGILRDPIVSKPRDFTHILTDAEIAANAKVASDAENAAADAAKQSEADKAAADKAAALKLLGITEDQLNAPADLQKKLDDAQAAQATAEKAKLDAEAAAAKAEKEKTDAEAVALQAMKELDDAKTAAADLAAKAAATGQPPASTELPPQNQNEGDKSTPSPANPGTADSTSPDSKTPAPTGKGGKK